VPGRRADLVAVPAGRGRGLGVLDVLRPKLAAMQRRAAGSRSGARIAVLAGVGGAFWLLMFAILFRMLLYFRGAEEIGEVLAVRLLGLILLSFLAILLLSNLISALSTFFLSRDLELLMASPIDPVRVYGARLAETMTYSSWMVALMMVPILASYGVAYRGGPAFVLASLTALAALFVIAAVVGSATTLLLVNIFPARRARDLLALIALLAVAGLVVLLRLLRPEQLVRPEGFQSLVAFLAALEAPGATWLPSEWAAQAMMAPLRSGQTDWFPLFLLTSTPAAAVVAGAWLHGRYFAHGFSRAQEGASLRESRRAGGALLDRLLSRLAPPDRALVAKEVRTFFRDTTQWSQLILLGVLVVIYVYNIKVLPFLAGGEVGYFLVNVVSFLNLGLAGFVLAAIAARFLFPAVSLEGRTLWLLRSSPLMVRRLIWTKYWVNLIPLLAVALGLTAGTNHILQVGPFMMALSLATITVVTFTMAAMALGFGAAFPRFDTTNAADIPTGFGGLVFMMTAVGYLGAVIVIQARPVHAILTARLHGVPATTATVAWLVAALAGIAAISGTAIVLSLRTAIRQAGAVEAG
jgi:ABC-2 type transport system permease protein